jgi:hypothetical protein
MFINGIQTGSTYSDSQNYVNGANRPALGIDANALNTSYFNGYMSNVKVIKGKALYTTNFSIPTAPATSTDAPVLLLSATNAGIIDQTGKNNITTYGTAAISSTQSKFGGSSISFNGSTDYLQVSINPNNLLDNADFTFEFWIYPTNGSSTSHILGWENDTSSNTWGGLRFGFNSSGGSLYPFVLMATASTGWALNYTTPTSLNLNQWNHVALVRSGSNIYIFLNGTQNGTTQSFSGTVYQNSTNYYIGAINSSGMTSFFSGYIDDFRFTRSYARYTANFTPPTSAFPDL